MIFSAIYQFIKSWQSRCTRDFKIQPHSLVICWCSLALISKDSLNKLSNNQFEDRFQDQWVIAYTTDSEQFHFYTSKSREKYLTLNGGEDLEDTNPKDILQINLLNFVAYSSYDSIF